MRLSERKPADSFKKELQEEQQLMNALNESYQSKAVNAKEREE